MSIAELLNITKDYLQPATGNSTRVLDDISLVIPSNETIAITGPSGSGKTTLLNILGTLDQPTSGSLTLDGKDIRVLQEDQLASLRNRFIGFVFQQHLLLPQLNVIENILLPAMPIKEKEYQDNARIRAIGLLEQAGLKDHLYDYPARLSVGECQRTAVVRALINLPKLLLADEPTGSLDAGNASKIADLLTGLQETYGYALVLVTHDPQIAKRMKIHYQLINGKLQPGA